MSDTTSKPVIEVPAGEPPAELVVEDLVVGDGAEATSGATVNVDYVGVSWSTGAEFDASWNRGAEAFEFVLGRGMVIEGWDAGVVGMAPGGRRNLQIPFAAAYGAEGRPPTIPAESDLIFVVDLLSVTKPKSPGDGEELVIGQTAVLHLTITAYNTKVVVDSTYEDGFPVPIPLGTGSLLPGLEQGLLGMQPGGQRLLVVPPDLAFGDAGREPDIAAGESLVIVAELVEIR